MEPHIATLSFSIGGIEIHGSVGAVHLAGEVPLLPSSRAVSARELPTALMPEEQKLYEAMSEARKLTFALGRSALRAAMPNIGEVGIGARGEPLVPAGLAVSISHKGSSAVATAVAVSHAQPIGIGIDLATQAAQRVDITAKVVRADEQTLAGQFSSHAAFVRTVFSLKEATYKAISPWAKRYVGFLEAKLIATVNTQSFEVAFDAFPELRVHANYQIFPGVVLCGAVAIRR